MKTNQGSFRHPEWADVTGTMTATLSAVRLPDDEVEVYATAGDGYAAWQPKGNIDHPEEPGNDLEIKVSVQKKGDPGKPRKARFFVSIPSVSMNVGVCGNWPKGAREAEGLRFLDKDFPEKDGLLFKDKTHLESDIFMEKASFRVHAYDYGAWGTVRITARDEDGKELKVKVNGKDSPDLDVPQDDDSNRIADSWRRDKAFKHNMNEDNESVQGQDAKGDGITLYNEYRGLAILNDQGARKHKQLDPDLKEMFVLDPAKKLLMKKWEDITAIRSYRVDELSVDPDGNTGPGESPLVNFNSEDKTAHPFYALKVVVLAKGPDDNPYPAFAESAKDEPKCIKNAFAVYVVPSRAVERVQEDYEWLDAAITEPDSNIGKELREKGPAMGIVYEDAVEAWHRLQDPDLRKTISAKIEAFLFCHEIGHILGADDHRGAPPDGLQEEGWACVMFNQREWGRRRTLVHSAMGRGDATFPFPYRDFCRGLSKEFDCYRLLNVKDW